MAKRKTTTKKSASRTTTRKASSKAAARKKPAASKKKKAPAKKAVSKKKPTVAKKSKVTTKKTAKKVTKKKVIKKPTAKKPASKKAPAKKKSSARKKSAATPAVGKKRSAKAGASAKKPAAPPRSKKTPAADPESDARLKAARAAASRLAALAGLPAVVSAELASPAAAVKHRRLTKSPLTASSLAAYRELLLQKRGEVAGDVSAIEGEALNPSRSGSLSSLPQHMADQGTDEFEQTLSLGIAASQRRLLIEIDAAIDRIDAGVYGICEMTGQAIHKARLEATPWCRYSLEGARMADRGQTPS